MLFVVIIYAAILNIFILNLLYGKTVSPKRKNLSELNNVTVTRPTPLKNHSILSILKPECIKAIENSIVVQISETEGTNYGIIRMLKQLDSLMPTIPQNIYLLSTAETFTTSLRLWCKRHTNCHLVIARNSEASENFESLLFQDRCSKHFIFLRDSARIDSSFAQRLKMAPENMVSCLFEDVSCSNSNVAWKLPRFFLEKKRIQTYEDIEMHASRLNLLSNNVAVVKQ